MHPARTEARPRTSRSAAVGVAAVASASAVLLPLKRWLQGSAPQLTHVRVLDVQIAYQLLTMAMTALLILGLRRLGAQGRLLAVGDLDTPAKALSVLGVKEGEPWRRVLRNFALIATGTTALVVYFQVARSSARLSPHLFAAFVLSLPFAAANAAVEEGLFRVALLEATDGVVKPERAALLSGVMFGSVHYWGVPGGAPGVVMAGFLGFVLARSMLETRGVLGAWFLHFLQDVVIFTLIFAVALAGGVGA